MVIGIEASKIHNKDGGGTVYPKKLIPNLLKLDQVNSYIIFVSEKIEDLRKYNNCRQIIIQPSDGLINFFKFYFFFKNIAKKFSLDLLHLLTAYGVFVPPFTTISTIHDLRYLTVPELTERRFGQFLYKSILPRVISSSSHLIANSKDTKESLMEYYNISEKKITVTPLGHEMIKNNEQVIIQKKLPEQYFLWVGRITNRKNLKTLYLSYKKFIEKYQKKNISISIAIVGIFSDSVIEKEHKDLIEKLDIDKYVYFQGYVSDQELQYMYQNAEAFIFPSIYEGFGIPIIEAMALDCPVITTIDGGATKEVAGDAALFFNKYNTDELAYKMFEITDDQELRNNLILKGRERAKEYTWENTAKLTLNVYNKIFNSSY